MRNVALGHTLSPAAAYRFNMDYLIELLVVGLKGVTIAFLWFLPVILLVIVASITILVTTIMGAGAALLDGSASDADTLFAGPVLIGFLVVVAAAAVLSLAPMLPLQVALARVELTGSFPHGLQFGAMVRETILVAPQLAVGIVVLVPISMATALLGLLLCIVGVFPAGVVNASLWGHFRGSIHGAL